jgi:uncharacterized RDD family membrane protein YckC
VIAQPAREALDVATPERVAMSLPVAGIGPRVLAYLVDAGLLFAFWAVVYFGLSLLVSDMLGAFQSLAGLVQVLLVVGVFATQWVYWTACELLTHGQSPGKRVLKIRVMRADGSPVSFLDSALRNLTRAVDFLPVGYALGLLAMLMNRQHKRLGDFVAGTVLVREETIDLDRYAPPAAAEQVVEALPVVAPTARSTPLSTGDVQLVVDYLDRVGQLWPEPRRRIGERLVDRVGGPELDPETRAKLIASPETLETFLRDRIRESR